MTETERILKEVKEMRKAGDGRTSTQTGRSAASPSSGRSDTERILKEVKEMRKAGDGRTSTQTGRWEDYKKKNDLERKAAADRQRAAYMEKKRELDQQSYTQYIAAQRQLEENQSRDAAEDEIRELTRNPFLSDAEWQARALERAASRYGRDFPLYQEMLKSSAYSPALYNRSYSQAAGAYNDLIAKRDSYTTTMKKAEEERNKSNLVNRPAQWQAENLTPQEIEQRLAYYRSEAATPTVTDRDREARAYLYPEAALQKDPHGARFDERLVEDAGQDAVDAAYRPILTDQEKAAVEEADRQIIEEKAERNYEQVQRLLAAQAGQTEAASRARGNELIDEIAQGGEAANKAKTGKVLFEKQQKKIDEESPTIIYGARGNYSSAMAERTKRGYILGSDWDNVPEDRKQAVYALYTESPEKAIELAKYYIADVRNAEDEERQAWYAQSGWTAALGLASSAAAHLGAAADPFGPVGQELTRYGDNALAGGSQWADAATGYQKIPEWVPIVGGKGAGDFYQTVGSVVQSAAVAAPAILAGRYDTAAAETIGKLGLALMGSSAAASDYRESVAAGMDEDRAKLHALAAGVEEALFEEISLDKLIKMDTSGGLKSALKNWLVQSGIEGSEELATSIANRITDEMISGAGQSKVERRASELIANGMNSTEAHTQAESEWMTDTLYEGFSGFLSGGMMTGGNYALQGAANLAERAVNAVETRKAQRQAGAAVSRSEGSVEALQAYAKDKGIEIKDVETAEQNAGESAEQGSQDGSRQNSYSSRDYRSISDTNSKVVQSIRSEVRGKTTQEQQAVRDSLVEKYGEGIAPAVYNAISIETASRVRQEYGDVDSIQAARNQAVSEINDESLRRAVSDGYDSAAYSLAASQGGENGMNTMSRYIQQRRNTGSGEMSMNATVTAQDGSTKTIAITGMSEDGKRVSLADGSEVAVKDLQADADTTSAIQQLADLDLGADATKVLQAYQQSGVAGTEGYRWLMDYATAYNQGRTRQISLEQAAQRSSLDERTVMDAYTLGQQAANRETQAGLEKLKNLPKRKGASGRTANIDTTEIKGKTMSKSELEQFELANQYAQALGVDMKWFSSKEQDGKFVGKNGAYENGKIYMDIHAGRNFAADLTSGILATMGHELTHFQKQYAPEEYQALKEFLFEQIVKSSPNGEARLERLIWEKQRRSGNTLSRKAAEDEVVADACQKMLRDSKTVHDFASQQPEAANSLVRWLDKWFKRVRSIFGRGGNYSEEAQLMDSLEQDVKAAFGELWDKALKQAAKVHDEVGNIENAAIQEQNSDRDAEYLELAQDPGKNAARLQEMVDEAARRAGYDTGYLVWRGDSKPYNVLKTGAELDEENGDDYNDDHGNLGNGLYFTPDRSYAERFAGRGGVLRKFYLKSNMADLENADVRAIRAAIKQEIEDDFGDFSRDELYERLMEETGTDGIRAKGIGGFSVGAAREAIVRESWQAKLSDPVTYDDDGNVIPLSERFNEANEDIRYSERDYSTPSDEELLMNARVEDADNADQGRLLKDYQALGKRIATLEKQLAEAKRQTQLTNRALNTRGIGNVVKTVMKDYDITDARHNGTAKNAVQALTDGYQKALDLLDKGASPADVNDAVYNGAVKAAEIILEQGTYSQNLGGKWQVYSASRYLGDNSQELIDSFVSEAYADFVSNRYREARPETAADRLVARTKKEAQERVDKYKGRSDALAEANRRLEEKTTQAETEAKEARKAAGELFLEIKDLRQELMDNKTMSEQERKAASKKLKSLNKSLEAKREEAASWQKRAKRNASLLKSALESKSRDISALNNRLSKEQAAALEKQKNLEAKLEKQIQRERDILAGKLRAPELVKMLKVEREKAETRVKEQKEQVFQNYKERKAATDLRGRIKNLSDEMKRRMTNPTDRAYVPASLYQSMTRLADVLDNVLSPNPGTKAEARYRAMMDAIRGMAREYEDVKNLDPVFASEYEQEISDAIGEIERILERKNASWIDNLTEDTQKGLAELNSDELQQLYDLMRQINYTITNATKVFGNSNYKSIFDAQRAVAEQQNSMKSLNAVSRLERKKRLRLLNGLSVMRATEMMAGWDRSAALYQLMHGIEQGADDAWAWVMDYNKSMQDLKTGKNEKEYRQALTKQLDFGITDRDGLKVTMTKMQALQILMTAEREEHNDKLLHLQAGGAVIRNAIDLQNGKGAKARSQTISVTPELIQKINDSLTDWDRAYMKTVRDYFKREGKRTNEILYKLKHKVLKTEEFYVPYTVDRNYLEANLNEQQALNMWVKTPGSTNALKQKAKQPVIIDGMDTVMVQHVKEIGNYIGMAIPIRDFSKVYNGMIPTEGPNPLPVKETIERTFGKAGQHLLTQAVIDVQGGTARQNWESNIAQFLNKLQGAFVKSALLINPSVTIKQAASYIAAESVISHLALERGNHSVWARTDESKSFMPGGLIAQLFARPEGKTAQRIYNEIDQYTSLHYQRRQGMSMAEIAEQANRTGPIKRRINAIGASMEQSKIGHVARRTGENLNPLTWIQRMDVATTAALWVACKEQAKLDKLTVGSEEFWKRTTELYERCIRETQPMYDGLHRTANQKQAGGLMQYLFPFRTVPIQNHGQLAASYEAYKAARESKNEAKIKEAGKFFRKTVWAQTESAFVFSAMTFLAAILKRKTKKYRDEEGEFDAGSFTKGLLTDVGSTLISVLNPMYGSELFNLGSRAVDKFEGNSGYTYDAFSVGVVDMINDLASSGDRLLADAGKIVRGENVNAADFWNHAMNLLVKGGKLAGIPADTVKTYFEGTKGNIQDAIEGRIPALNDESWERDAATNARRYLKAYMDNDTKKASAVLAELRSNLSKNGKDEGKINEAIRKYVSAQAVEKVADGTWTEEEAEAYLLSTGAYDDRENPQKDAWNAIRKGVAKSASTDEEYNWKQYDELAEAVANGEDVTGILAEYRNHGYSDDQINAAIRSGIQEALTAGDLDGNEAADALIRYGVTYSKDGKAVAYDEQTAWKKVQEWADKAEHTDEEGELEDGYKYSAYADLFDAVDANQNADGIIQTMVQNGGYDTDSLRSQIKDHLLERFIAGQITETALKNQLSRYCKITKTEDANEIVKSAKCKRDFGVSPDGLKEAFKDGDLSQNQTEKALQQYKGLSKTDAQNRVQYWGYNGDLSENAWLKWNKDLKGSGLSVENWEKVSKVKNNAKGTDANGDGRADSGTVKAEVVSYIDSMNIPKSQKKAIYLAFGWAASTMPNWR